MCPGCWSIVAPLTDPDGTLRCPTPECATAVVPCQNYVVEAVCNQYVAADAAPPQKLCQFCSLTAVIPDLSVNQNRQRWRDLEAAKRRVLYTLVKIGYPITPGDSGVVLSFDFKADGPEKVHTGHANGRITINLREADAVEREKARVHFGEPQRTLVGHFRHELGHYIWDRLVAGRDIAQFRERFGDERSPSYADALARHHRQGPPANWASGYVSAYATMHPWEDFAETFGAYLDMVSVLHTAQRFELVSRDERSFDQWLREYQRIGLIANEWNRDMGLLDLVPEVFTSVVSEKIRYVDSLRGDEPLGA